MYPKHGQFSGEARNGVNNFRRTGAVYTNASRSLSGITAQRTYGSVNGLQSSNFAGSFRRPRSFLSRNLVYTAPANAKTFKPAVNTARNIPVNALECRYEGEDTMDDTVPRRSKSSTVSNDSNAVPQVLLGTSCTTELRGIPKWMNTIAQLDSHFSEYGRLMDIKVEYQADPGAATVTFSNQAEAGVAYRSTAIGFRNGSWTFKAPNTTRNNQMHAFKMPPRETARTFIRKGENKNEGLQRRKQELLDGYCKQLEALKAILAKCGPNDPGRGEKLNMIKRLLSSMEGIQSAASHGVQSQEKQTFDRTGTQGELEVAGRNPTDQLADPALISLKKCGSDEDASGKSRKTSDNNSLRDNDNGTVEKVSSVNKTIKVDVDETGTQGKIEVAVNGGIAESAIAHNKIGAVRDIPTPEESNNHSSKSCETAYANNALRNGEATDIGQPDLASETTDKSLLGYSSLDYEWEYPDLSGN